MKKYIIRTYPGPDCPTVGSGPSCQSRWRPNWTQKPRRRCLAGPTPAPQTMRGNMHPAVDWQHAQPADQNTKRLRGSRAFTTFLGKVTWPASCTWAACGSGRSADWPVTRRLLVWSPATPSWGSRSPWARSLTLTAPEGLAVALRDDTVVSVWMNEWMLGYIVKCFEWPLVRKALYECSLFNFTVLIYIGQTSVNVWSSHLKRRGDGQTFLHSMNLRANVYLLELKVWTCDSTTDVQDIHAEAELGLNTHHKIKTLISTKCFS